MAKIKFPILVLILLAAIFTAAVLIQTGTIYNKNNKPEYKEELIPSNNNKDSTISFSTFENASEMDLLETELNSLDLLELEKDIEEIKQETNKL